MMKYKNVFASRWCYATFSFSLQYFSHVPELFVHLLGSSGPLQLMVHRVALTARGDAVSAAQTPGKQYGITLSVHRAAPVTGARPMSLCAGRCAGTEQSTGQLRRPDGARTPWSSQSSGSFTHFSGYFPQSVRLGRAELPCTWDSASELPSPLFKSTQG